VTKVSNSVAYASGLVYKLVKAAVDQTEVSYGLMLLGIKSTLLALCTWCKCVCVSIDLHNFQLFRV